MRVDAAPVFVERYAGVDYARFAMQGPVRVEIAVERPITSHAAFPAERVAGLGVAGTHSEWNWPRPNPGCED